MFYVHVHLSDQTGPQGMHHKAVVRGITGKLEKKMAFPVHSSLMIRAAVTGPSYKPGTDSDHKRRVSRIAALSGRLSAEALGGTKHVKNVVTKGCVKSPRSARKASMCRAALPHIATSMQDLRLTSSPVTDVVHPRSSTAPTKPPCTTSPCRKPDEDASERSRDANGQCHGGHPRCTVLLGPGNCCEARCQLRCHTCVLESGPQATL